MITNPNGESEKILKEINGEGEINVPLAIALGMAVAILFPYAMWKMFSPFFQ